MKFDVRGVHAKAAQPLTRRPRRGFTLVEAAMVTVIVGLSIVGVVELLGAGSMANADATELTVAVNLAQNIEELLQGATYSTLLSTYSGHSYSPPVDNRGTSLTSFSNWSQTITVKYVDPSNVTSILADSNVQDTARVTVTIQH